ncbi:hypothetical protein BJ944DRAFT_239995 [Cunninghamella echinulata]|nr:hypothetical protein BJ944DRAFT_239995 [Cunninghamella echinulata]
MVDYTEFTKELQQAFKLDQEIKLSSTFTIITNISPAHINTSHYSRDIRRRNAISIPLWTSSLIDQYNYYFFQKMKETKKQQEDEKNILIRMRQLISNAIHELKCLSNQLLNAEKRAQYWQYKCSELQLQLEEMTLLQQNTATKLEIIQRKLIESEHVRIHWNKIPTVTFQYSSSHYDNNQKKSSLKKKTSLTTNISRILHMSS